MDRTYSLSAVGLDQHDLRRLDWGIRMASNKSGAKWRLSHSEQDADVVAVPASGEYQTADGKSRILVGQRRGKSRTGEAWLKSPITPSAVVKLLDQLATSRQSAEGAQKARQKIHGTGQRLDRQIIVYGEAAVARKVVETAATSEIQHAALDRGGLWSRRRVHFGHFQQDDGVTVGLAAIDATRSLLAVAAVNLADAFLVVLIDPTKRQDSQQLLRTLRALEGTRVAAHLRIALCIEQSRAKAALDLWRPWVNKHLKRWGIGAFNPNHPASVGLMVKTLARPER